MTVNIENSFEYTANEAKKSAQGNINSLLVLHDFIQEKHRHSVDHDKNVSYLTIQEMEFLMERIIDITSNLHADFVSIDRVNRLTNKLYRCALKIRERQPTTPNLKELLA